MNTGAESHDIRSFLGGFGIDANADNVADLATMINRQDSDIRAILASFTSVNGVFQSAAQPNEPARGPLVCAIDDSESMHDEHRRVVAHAIALALAAQAIREQREAALIKFAGPDDELTTCRYPDPDNPDESPLQAVRRLVNWAMVKQGGGTDFDRPLETIIDIANKSQRNGCDAVLITDDTVGVISPDVVQQWSATRQSRDLALKAIVIQDEVGIIRNLDSVADTITAVTPDEFTVSACGRITNDIASFVQSRREHAMQRARQRRSR